MYNNHHQFTEELSGGKNGPTCFHFQAEQARWQAEHCHDLSGHYLQVQEISKKDSNF